MHHGRSCYINYIPILLVEQGVLNADAGVGTLLVRVVDGEGRRRVGDGNSGVATVASSVRPVAKASLGSLLVALSGESRDARRVVQGLSKEEHGLGLHSQVNSALVKQILHVGVGDGCDGRGDSGQAGAGEEGLDPRRHIGEKLYCELRWLPEGEIKSRSSSKVARPRVFINGNHLPRGRIRSNQLDGQVNESMPLDLMAISTIEAKGAIYFSPMEIE